MTEGKPTTQTGIRIPDDTLGKAKYIAWFERETLTARLVELIDVDIAKWEKKNGAITPEMIAKATTKK